MRLRKMTVLMLLLVFLALIPLTAIASTTTFDVYAYDHSSNYGYGAGLDTGIDLVVGDLLNISADPWDDWSAGYACRTSGPDGLGLANPYGCLWYCYSHYGVSFRFGSLVGRVGDGEWFLISSSYERVIQNSGRLVLYYWDINRGDNSGYITATVQVNEEASGVGIPYNECTPNDADGDGVPDSEDVCPYGDDTLDTDGDGIPDDCDDQDTDSDGVSDEYDLCLETPVGATVDADGCSIGQICPCDNNWKNHGSYVSCVAHAAKDFAEAGLIYGKDRGAIVSDAAKSSCGKKNN